MKKRKPLSNRHYPVDLLQNQYWFKLSDYIRDQIYAHRYSISDTLISVKPLYYAIYYEEEI